MPLTELTALERHLIGRVPAGQSLPLYGSAKFDVLAEDDPRRAASVIRAAAAWRLYRSPEQVAEDLRRQLADEDEALWQRIRQTSWDVSAAAGPHQGQRLSYAELAHRRGDITSEQLVEWEGENRSFLAGLTDRAPRVLRRGRAA